MQVFTPPTTAMVGHPQMLGATVMGQQYVTGGQYMLPQMVSQPMLIAQQPQYLSVGLQGGWGMPTAPMQLGMQPDYAAEYAAQQQQFQQQQSQQQAYHDPVTAFMEQLGIESYEEHYFRWIAELGLQTPLPPRWESCADPSTGFTYYVDLDRQTSSWENPLLPSLQRIIEFGREYFQNPSDSFFSDARQLLWEEQKHQLDLWHGPFSNSAGQEYYVNSSSGTVSVRDPRTEAQYIFELQTSFLSSLGDYLRPQTGCSEAMDGVWPGQEGSAADYSYSEDVVGAPGAEGQDVADLWRTDTGAEVLILDSSPDCSPISDMKALGTERALRRLAALKASSRVDHRSTLQVFSEAYLKLQTAISEDEESQRLRLKKLAKQRKNRRRRLGRNDQDSTPALTGIKLPPAPAMEGMDSIQSMGLRSSANEDTLSALPGRQAPVALGGFDEDEPFALTTGSMGSVFASMVLPPKDGRPSPANFVRPPPSALNAGFASALPSTAEAGEEDAPLPPVMPSSPSLRKRAPDREWTAEAFVASAVARAPRSGVTSGAGSPSAEEAAAAAAAGDAAAAAAAGGGGFWLAPPLPPGGKAPSSPASPLPPPPPHSSPPKLQD